MSIAGVGGIGGVDHARDVASVMSRTAAAALRHPR